MQKEFMSAVALAKEIKARRIGVAEAVNQCLRVIERTDPKISAFITVCGEQARKRADIIQKQIDRGQTTSMLAGVPIGLKDNISTKGIPTSCASKSLEGYTPVFNATVVDRLEQAGMIVVGKLNMDEFAMGGSTETGIRGSTRNPWDKSRVAGGSSGGSAAAVAAGQVPVALGSDTGGSIRQPSGFCGVTGIKPTYGSVSRYGLLAYASSLDQIGSMGRTAEDCAAVLSVIAGADQKDSTCVMDQAFHFPWQKDEDLKGMKIGLPMNYFEEGLDEDVRTCVLKAARQLETQGAHIEEFHMPLMDYTVPAYYIIACAEASSNLSRYDGVRYGYRHEEEVSLSQMYRMSRSRGFGMEVKRRIMLGSFVLSSGYYDAYYKKGLQVRTLLKKAYDDLFSRYDLILSPTAPEAAYKIGEKVDDPMKMYMGDVYTVSANMAGLPAIALPCGFSRDGLPIGFQLMGKAFAEPKLVWAANVYQGCTDHHKKVPGEVIG